MAKESFSPGTQVVHIKMQVIGQVVKTENDLVHVQIASTMPIQVWKRDELAVWDARGEIQKKLKQGGYIRKLFKKMDE
jgi:hypothetical protein